ncbi:MAG: hypothetical protein CO125_01740 [Hydrogenophilales bacterium CG_4_9_14_3_um_filter_59_35]|nr:MAG: hypothetical protein CO125_01740 [Hydrogenophilales bacterium CG_4_9_14_3_um_filter_59_35]
MRLAACGLRLAACGLRLAACGGVGIVHEWFNVLLFLEFRRLQLMPADLFRSMTDKNLKHNTHCDGMVDFPIKCDQRRRSDGDQRGQAHILFPEWYLM